MKTLLILLSFLLGSIDQTLADNLPAKTMPPAEVAALNALQAAHGTAGTVVAYLDLSQAFSTRVPWAFVAIQGPSTHNAGEGEQPGAIAFCLVRSLVADCKGPRFPPSGIDIWSINNWDKDLDYRHFADVRIVPASGNIRSPLLLLTGGSLLSGDGNQVTSTFVLAYDKRADRFVGLFANTIAKNNNERTRLIERGIASGYVISNQPTPNAPFSYYVTVYRPSKTGSYVKLFRYRSRTRYGDGNNLAVIDSEMPNILSRLHLWKSGDPLPKPSEMPVGCHALQLRDGVEWCR